jgi:hypothetical protein
VSAVVVRHRLQAVNVAAGALARPQNCGTGFQPVEFIAAGSSTGERTMFAFNLLYILFAQLIGFIFDLLRSAIGL